MSLFYLLEYVPKERTRVCLKQEAFIAQAPTGFSRVCLRYVESLTEMHPDDCSFFALPKEETCGKRGLVNTLFGERAYRCRTVSSPAPHRSFSLQFTAFFQRRFV